MKKYFSVFFYKYDIVKTKTNNNEDCLCKNQVF